MHIVVCVKQVPDWDIPPSSFKVDEATNKVVPPPGVAPVPSQFDTIGVEAAMRIKDQHPDTKVTIMSMGPDSARDAIKHSLAMGADEGVLLTDALFDDLDWYQIALVLSTAVKKLDDVSLVICGRQAVDWDMGVSGSGIAELLDWPALTIGKDVQIRDGTVAVERVLMDGFETVEAALPAVATVSNELGEPRYPKLQQIMQAAKKQVTVLSAADLGLDASQLGPDARKLSLEQLYVPVSDVECEFMEGDTPEEKAQNLAKRLAEAKLI
ncbi:MAG: electron transfer flavoprotein subunit beta/FixA family protein [Dehalococcoidia bacterium]